MKIFLLTLVAVIIAGSCYVVWEKRSFLKTPVDYRTSSHQGNVKHIHEEFSGFEISEGKRLYHSFNCHTCHASGGGDIGPALMDDKWFYGSSPERIFNTIVEGRPNGMPAFGEKVPEAQIWQIVAYVRSMTGHTPLATRPGRNDDIQATKPETRAKKQDPVSAPTPGDIK